MNGAVRPPSLGTWLAHQLAEQIIDHTLPGGTRLLEMELATKYGLSRAPVRDALRMLEVDRLVDILPHRGAVVRPLTAEDIDEFWVCLAALDGMVMRLAAARLSDADLTQLRDLYAQTEAAALRNDGPHCLYCWEEIVSIVRAACGNKLLLEMTQRFDKQKRRFRRLLISPPGRIIETTQTRIEPLLHALEQHDPDAAEQRAREIALGARDGLLEILASVVPANGMQMNGVGGAVGTP
jgi:DNA-binding GntR family transcriptional regulator